MATEKDHALVQFLLDGTDNGQVQWEPTAVKDQFTTSFKGKYNVTVDKGTDDDPDTYWLTLKDDTGRDLLTLYQPEVHQVSALFHKAQRASLNVDGIIDEIMGNTRTKLTDDDIPF